MKQSQCAHRIGRATFWGGRSPGDRREDTRIKDHIFRAKKPHDIQAERQLFRTVWFHKCDPEIALGHWEISIRADGLSLAVMTGHQTLVPRAPITFVLIPKPC